MLLRVEGPEYANFVYHSSVLVRDDGGTPVIRHIGITEYMVIALLCFPEAAFDSAFGVDCIDSHMEVNVQGVIIS